MAARKLIWTHKARIRLYQILKFYSERNKSKIYSAKLYKKINQKIELILKQPYIGIKSEIENVRGIIVDDFFIFYEITDKQIIIHTIWNTWQNPDDLFIK